MAERPTGTVTFLFTDVEGSTRLWEQHPDEMQAALERHDDILRSAIDAQDGYVFSTAGDAFAAAFARAGDAVKASQAAQRALDAEPWPDRTVIRVRMGLHTGEAQERDGDYFGPALNRAARIMAAGHGGQVLLSSATAGLVDGSGLLDLGEHRLKDLSASERLFQVGPGMFAPIRSLESVRHNLPIERSPLIGRKEDIDAIAELLTDHRLVTLLGIGGTGKTRLAAAVAAEMAEQFGDGVWFVDLVPATSMDGVVEAIATAVGLQLVSGSQVDSLAELIAERDMLVVLDNCEHLTDDVADVVDVLLDRTSRPRFLATSREPLQLLDERQAHVRPLSVAEDLASPALQLFASAAERVGARVGPDDVAVASRICDQLDGVPLSIELAAAQLRQLSLEELADRVGSHLELVSRRRGGRGRRQASLLAVLEDSWALLDDREHELLLQLAAFPSRFGVEDVEAVSRGLDVGVPAQTLGGLVDRGLVAQSGDTRHRLLETVKVLARSKWLLQTDPDAYLERHTAWVLGHLAAYPAPDWYTSFEIAGWAQRDHYEDHRAVEDRLVAAGRFDDLAQLVAMLTFTYSQGSGSRSAAVIDRVDTYLDEPTLDTRQKGRLCLVAASASLPARLPAVMGTRSSEAVDLFRVEGGPEELAAALIIHSWMTVFTDHHAAIGLLDEAMSLAEQSEAPAVADVALSYQASFQSLAGRLDDADATLDRLLDRLGSRLFDSAWHNYFQIRMAVHVLRDPAIAQGLSAAMRAELQAIGWTEVAWSVHLQWCWTAAATGDVSATRELLAETERAVSDNASDDGLPDLLIPLAVLAWATGDRERSSRWVTAIRHSPRPTHNFLSTCVYKQLRTEVGLQDENPLDDASFEEIYRDATGWLAMLMK